MKYFLSLTIFLISLNLYSQQHSLLVAFQPNDCPNFNRKVNNLLQKVNEEVNLSWVLEEGYSGQVVELEKALSINLRSRKIIFSDSLFRSLTKIVSSASWYFNDSLLHTIPLVNLSEDFISLLNTTSENPKEKVIFSFPKDYIFSNNNTIIQGNDGFLVLDNIYNKLALNRNDSIYNLNGKDIFTKEVYFDIFKSHSYFDSIKYYSDGVKDIGYNTIQFKNITFNDSLIALLCGVPIITRLEIDRSKVAVLPSDAIIFLDKKLNYIGSVDLSSIMEIKSNNVEHFLSHSLFEYYQGNYYVNFSFRLDTEFNKNTKLFGKFHIDNRNEIHFKLLDIAIPENYWTFYNQVSTFFIGRMPFIYSMIFPFEINFDKNIAIDRMFSGFSIVDLNNITSGSSMNKSVFIINSIFQNEDYLSLLYSKGKRNFKEIYNIRNGELLHRKEYEVFVIKGRKSNVIPNSINSAIYLNNQNSLIEVYF